MGEARSNPVVSRRALLAGGAAALLGAGRVAAIQPSGLRRYNTPFYVLWTDVPVDVAREASIRMTAMAREYADRTSGFGGRAPRGMPFYLHADEAGYLANGGAQGSAGVFQLQTRNGRPAAGRLMAWLRGPTFAERRSTWRTVQHEGFHQFSQLAIGGIKPPWLEEGMAEVFESSEFCGDSFVTGLAPAGRVAAVQALVAEERVVPFPEIMLMSQEQWNGRLDATLYLQSWSMVYFLMYGEDRRWVGAFENFVGRIGNGQGWQDAFLAAFGRPEGFQDQWAAWWASVDPSLSRLDYLAATVRKLSAFAARAELADRPITDFTDFHDVPPMRDADWLPPGLLDEALEESRQFEEVLSGAWSVARVPAPQPKVRRYGAKRVTEVTRTLFTAGDGTGYWGEYLLGRDGIEVLIGTKPVGD